jgi:hypothetical protein
MAAGRNNIAAVLLTGGFQHCSKPIQQKLSVGEPH